MGCQFWLNEDGQLVEDDNGTILYSEECPCGDCCERLAKLIAKILKQTTQTCIPCDQMSWNENCGECEIPDPNPDPENPMTQLGEYVTKRKNRIISFTCDTGFDLQGTGEDPQEGDIVTVSFCNDYTATTVYSASPSLTCQSDEPCCIFTHIFCGSSEGSNISLYPVIPAPDYPSAFNGAQAICEQEYWQTCFDTAPYGFVTCAAQVIAPRCWFDDYVQGSSPEPDYTPVWGVIGCFCMGDGKWKIQAVQAGQEGLIVVNSAFVPDKEQLKDSQGNPVYDDQHNPVMVVKCELTCDGLKGLIAEMISHYQSHGSVENALFATTDTETWKDWTGEIVNATCFWGYLPLTNVYACRCHARDSQTYRWMFYAFDCSCNKKQITGTTASTMDLNAVGIYESVTDNDLCDTECAVLWALMSYAVAEGMETSQPPNNFSDPRETGDGGVVLYEDQRVPGTGIYTIDGSPCIYAAWNDSHMIWIDCNCGLHVGCFIYATTYKFLKSVDPCVCVDFRELVDANPALFGVVDKQWGSHSIVHWEHTTPSHSYTGPYWTYGGTTTQHTKSCSKCDTGVEDVSISWYATGDPFIDYNMIIVHRIVMGEHEFGHVNKSGGISNYLLQASGAAMAGITTASFGFTNSWGTTQQYAYTTDGPDANYFCNGSASGVVGYYYYGTVYKAYCEPSGSMWCPCPDDPPDPLPICNDHSRERSIESIFCSTEDRSGNIAGSGEMVCFQPGTKVIHHPGQYMYVTNQTSCQDICTHWEPGYYTWNVFAGEFLNTSCGLLFNHCDGSSTPHMYLQNVGIPGSATIESTWAPKIQSSYGWYDQMYIIGSYPSSNTTVSGGYFVETRNSRGTLISYQAYFMPSGSQVHDVQSPKCHEANCTGKTVYADITAYCQSRPLSNTCECYNNTSSSDCVSPSSASN